MLQQPLIGVFCAGWLAVLIWLLHSVSHRSQGWLTGCFGTAFGYLALSLRLDTGGPAPDWLEGLRWALFGAALYSFARYRLARRAGRKSDAQRRD